MSDTQKAWNYKPLTDDIRSYLKINYQDMTNDDMAAELEVSQYKVHCWLKEMNISKKTKRAKSRATATEYFKHEDLITI